MRYKLQNGDFEAEFDSLGAELVSLKFRGTERLWQNENGGWAGHAPVLFPVCGNCAVIYGGARYPVGRHGFARKREFTLTERTENALSFRLREDGETLAQFPFAFSFTVSYLLEGNRLTIAYEAENSASGILYYSWGGHLSHALYAPFSQYGLHFPQEETLERLPHDGEGKLTGERIFWGKGRRFPLNGEPKDGETLIFAPRSRSVTLENARGKVVSLAFEGFPYLLLWRPKGADVLCLEPWANLPDVAGEEISFDKRRDILSLASGKRNTVKQIVTYYEV